MEVATIGTIALPHISGSGKDSLMGAMLVLEADHVRRRNVHFLRGGISIRGFAIGHSVQHDVV